MGTDVYLRWEGQTEAERKAQFCGFSIEHGFVGYLRESSHCKPSAIRVLLPEAYAGDGEAVPTPAALMRERLPEAEVAIARAYKGELSGDDMTIVSDVQKSFRDFVDLAARKEAENGKPCTVAVR